MDHDKRIQPARPVSRNAGRALTFRAVATIASEPQTFTCSRCNGTFGRDGMMKVKKNLSGVGALCIDCERARKHRSESGDLGWVAVHAAPDHRPAVRLRRSLERSRQQGLSWDEAWPIAVGYALRDVCRIIHTGVSRDDEREQWLEAFRFASPQWHAAYVRAPFDGCTPLWLPDETPDVTFR